MIKYIIPILLFTSCAISPIYKQHTCFQIKKSILVIEIVAKRDYFISIRKPGWKGALLEGLVPHEELETTIKEDNLKPVQCGNILRNKQ
jgi:hypothetical protein